MHRAWVINDYTGFQGLKLEQFDDREPEHPLPDRHRRDHVVKEVG